MPSALRGRRCRPSGRYRGPSADRSRRASAREARSGGRHSPGASRRAVAELEPTIERGQVAGPRGAGSHHPPRRAPDGHVAHATPRHRWRRGARAPWPRSRPIRRPGSLRHVIPPPTWSVRRRPSATNVRITMSVCHRAVRPDPAERARYTARAGRAPGPRGSPSRGSSGAPVIEPPGKEARGQQVERVAAIGANRPVTVDTRCWTAAVRSSRQSRGTRTVPGSQTRPRSFRSTSTIMTFSARSPLALSPAARARGGDAHPARTAQHRRALSARRRRAARAGRRLRAAFESTNRNPLGACAITGTGFPIDREPDVGAARLQRTDLQHLRQHRDRRLPAGEHVGRRACC